MAKQRHQSGEDVFHAWRERVNSGEADPVFLAGEGELERFPVAPGRVTILGGSPGQGKTAFIMQVATDALRINPNLRACICNVEMSPAALLDRQLARISGIDLSVLRKRVFGPEHADRIDQAMTTIEAFCERLSFVGAPYDLAAAAEAADAVEADLLVFDYIQRIRPPARSGAGKGDKRGDVDATMDYLRQFADDGRAQLVVSSVARTKDKKGRSSYDPNGLGLASFRESSELEFGADDAFMLVPHADDPDLVVLRHLKARHDEMRDTELEFDRRLQRFTPVNPSVAAGVRDDVARAWAAQKNKEKQQ